MKKILFTLLFLASVGASAQTTCKIYGNATKPDGVTPDTTRIMVMRCDKSGRLFSNVPQVYTPRASDGYYSFLVPRTTGTDSSYITVRANMGNLATGRVLGVPNADSALLQSLTGAVAYNTATVLIPSWYAYAQGDSLRINTLAFSDAFQLRRDAQGRVRVDRDPDSTTSGGGASAAQIRDSIAAAGGNYGYRAKRDTTTETFAVPHTWTTEQRHNANVWLYGSTLGLFFRPQDSTGAANLGVWATDYPFGNNGYYHDNVLKIGRKGGEYPKFELAFETKYWVADSYHNEFNLDVSDSTGTKTARPMTFITRHGDSRLTQGGMYSDIFVLGNGMGAGVSSDSSLTIRPPAFGAVGYVDITSDMYIRWNKQNKTLLKSYNGAAYMDLLATEANTKLALGSTATGTNAIDQISVRSRGVALNIIGDASKITLTGAPTWGTDSTSAATKGYVDTRIAAVSGGGISAAVLSDSLNANPRRDNGKLDITALTDTLNAKVTRGATIKADTASLAVIADKMYPRTATGGSGIPSDSLDAMSKGARAWGAEIDVPGGTRARIDSLVITGRTVQDSTGYAVTDSMQWRVVNIEQPKTWLTKAGAYFNPDGKIKTGTVTIEIKRNLPYGVVNDFAFYADSANAVQILSVQFDLNCYRAESDGGKGAIYQRGLIRYSGTTTVAVTYAWIYGGSDHTFAATMPTGSLSYLPVRWSGDTESLCTILATVTYKMPSASSSSWYVGMAE